MKRKYSWFTNVNIILNHVNMFNITETLITKLDVISLSVSAYTSTCLIIPLSFINTGQSFHSHPNTHAQSRYIAVSSVCF